MQVWMPVLYLQLFGSAQQEIGGRIRGKSAVKQEDIL